MQATYMIVGAGVFGLSAALSLRRAGHRVAVVSAGSIPHLNAASNDISKVVRMEYGNDVEYLHMAARCMEIWRSWNARFERPLYHETGFLILSRKDLQEPGSTFEKNSLHALQGNGYHPQQLTADDIAGRYGAFATGQYKGGFYHSQGGYAEAARTVLQLRAWAEEEGVEVREHVQVVEVLRKGRRIAGLRTANDQTISATNYIFCTGAFTLKLLPELDSLLRITAHPVYHIRPANPEQYTADQLPVFAADLPNSGWYGFPLHPVEGVVKIANHGKGVVIDPDTHNREVPGLLHASFRQFLAECMPGLVDDPIVYARLCAYSDARDGHYLIDKHPDYDNLVVATGGSGHAFKMTPLLGEWIRAAATDDRENLPKRFQWRTIDVGSARMEEARGGAREIQ